MRKYSKELYRKEAVLKAAYAYTDEMFVHIDVDNEYYVIELTAKGECIENEMYAQFENELIAQETRVLVAEKTKHIREMIVARALSSTIINTGLDEQETSGQFNADEILVDWFERDNG